MSKATVTALAPWFGSNRTLAENVGKALAGCDWVGVLFGGGMCELAHIKARSLVVNDLHRHIINLARVVADPDMKPELMRRLDAKLFHPDELSAAQERMKIRESDGFIESMIEAADDYFVCAWMGRSAKAGTDSEFSGSLPIRWNANGGDSNTRYRSAVESLDAWHEVCRRCNFHVRDAFDFLREVKDEPNHGLYADPPFPDAGDPYKHKFDEGAHRRLAMELGGFLRCRVVCRFYDHPLIRELYPESAWTWNHFAGRKQSNAVGAEVLLVNQRDDETAA